MYEQFVMPFLGAYQKKADFIQEGVRNNMKTILSWFLLMTVTGLPGAAHAVNWDLIDVSENMDLYIDLDSVKNHPVLPNVMMLWALANHTSTKWDAQKRKSIRSDKFKLDVDCRLDRSRGLALLQYSKINGRGDLVFSANNLADDWGYIAPGTTGESIANYVCKGITVDGLVPRVTGNAAESKDVEPPFKPQPRISTEFTKAYNRALAAMGNKASSLKADQQQWWKKREQTCGAIPEFLFQACMDKEEKGRIFFLNEMTKAFIEAGV